MQIIKVLAILLTTGLCNSAWAQSTEGHSGHGGGSGGGTNDVSCIKAKISHYKPEHMATVAPGSEYSFAVSGSNGPGHIHVSIRQEPVQVSIENKETFYLVKGRLPADIKNETVRISVKAKAKVGKCDADGGFLLKVTD